MARLPENEFPLSVRRLVAERVAQRCSSPHCGQMTAGPSIKADRRALRIGKAAHITAASENGPRYDPSLTPQQRRSLANALWLCSNCAGMVDDDPTRFPADVLRKWKQRAEDGVERQLQMPSPYRAIDVSEVQSELPLSDVCAVKALEEEFGCHVETDVHVRTNEGWLSLHGAVVREEDLIAIMLETDRGHGIRLFQVEYWLDLCRRSTFHRFPKCIVYLVVVSSAPPGTDVKTQADLQVRLSASGLEGEIRMYRLSQLRRKYQL